MPAFELAVGLGIVGRGADVSHAADTDELLGAHILGAEASDLIAEVGLARTLETTHYEVLKTVHAHPTLSEAIMEAVGNAYGAAIHI